VVRDNKRNRGRRSGKEKERRAVEAKERN